MGWVCGQRLSREDLLRRVGDVSQVAGLRRVEAAEGRGKGVGLVECWTAAGLSFTVALDRGMDIPLASFGGVPLCWHSPTGLVAPAFYEPEGLGWLWTFSGGLLTTCGLQHAGAPSDVPGETHGLHGRISAAPAENVSLDARWEGDDYVLRIRGTCREARVFGPVLRLDRTITTHLGARSFTIEDVVTNAHFAPQPHMILYHVNIGWPVLDAGSRFLVRSAAVEPYEPEAKADPDGWRTFHGPTKGYTGRCYFHTPEADADGRATVVVVNPAFHEGTGLGVALRYSNNTLPHLVEWKQLGEGHYVVGMEPVNCLIYPRGRLVKEGLLPVLEPGESRRYTVEVAVVMGADEVARLEDQAAGRR